MDIEGFKIYVDRLNDGKVENIHETFDPAFLEQQKDDLLYSKDVEVEGETYIAENELLIHLDVHTEATVPCTVCNQPVDVPIDLKNMYLIESLENAKSGIFIFKDLLREAILLEAPAFAECSNGNCPEREKLSNYFADSKGMGKKDSDPGDEGYQPFANLEL
jgi:DUF177 domain-containing protein